jgi:hypothetical protein
LKSTIPNLHTIYLPKKANSEKLGVGVWQSMQDSFFEFADEQALGEG